MQAVSLVLLLVLVLLVVQRHEGVAAALPSSGLTTVKLIVNMVMPVEM